MKIFESRHRNCIICIDLPDGTNYFQGIHDMPFPTKTGTNKVKVNVWTPDISALKDNAGLFTEEEAEFYLKIVATEGAYIKNRTNGKS